MGQRCTMVLVACCCVFNVMVDGTDFISLEDVVRRDSLVKASIEGKSDANNDLVMDGWMY
jgi:hypothetical protein